MITIALLLIAIGILGFLSVVTFLCFKATVTGEPDPWGGKMLVSQRIFTAMIGLMSIGTMLLTISAFIPTP